MCMYMCVYISIYVCAGTSVIEQGVFDPLGRGQEWRFAAAITFVIACYTFVLRRL